MHEKSGKFGFGMKFSDHRDCGQRWLTVGWRAANGVAQANSGKSPESDEGWCLVLKKVFKQKIMKQKKNVLCFIQVAKSSVKG